ncbi:MAG: 6-bladed beta-propeller [bacterium]
MNSMPLPHPGTTVLRLILAAILLMTLAAGPLRAADIQLPASPPSSRTVDLVEQWRVGGEGDEDVLLGLVQTAVMDADGNTYLLDRQLSQVLVISPEGEWIDTLGRQGEGPGELNRPHGLILMDSGQIAVIQGFPGRITLLNRDGTPGGEINIGEASEGGFNFVRELALVQGKLIGTTGRGTFDMEEGKSRTVSTLSVMDLEGKELAEIARHEQENDFQRRVFDEAANFSEQDQWTVSPQGVIYTAPERDAYAINARNLDGELLHTLRRDFSPRKRNEEDKQQLTDGMVIVMNGRRQEIESKTLDHDPAVMGLDVADDGRLFVTNCFDRRSELPEGCGARYDVISPEGSFIEELTLRVPDFNREYDNLVFLDGTHFMHLKNVESARDAMMAAFGGGEDEEDEEAEAEPLEVVMYAMP